MCTFQRVKESAECMCVKDIQIATTLFSFQERTHVKLLWKTDKSIELLLMACLSGEDNTVQLIFVLIPAENRSLAPLVSPVL